MGKHLAQLDQNQQQLRRQLASLSDDDTLVLAKYGPLITPHITAIVDDFYQHLQAHAPLSSIVAEHTTIDRLKATFRGYCTELFCGNYDAEYFAKRVQIGWTHARVGLSLVWYQGMHLYLRERLNTCIDAANHLTTAETTRFKLALMHIMALDQLIAVDAYVAAHTADLQTQTTRANEAHNAKTKFLAAVSHELRTPLSSILGFAELAIDSPTTQNEKVQRHLRAILRNAQSLLHIVNQLLDLSRIESGKWQVELIPTNIIDLLNDVSADLQQLIGSKPIQIIRSFGDLQPTVIACDQQKLRQVLLNLGSNASKFTEAGEIEIRAHVANKSLIIEVRDTGPGLTDKEAQEVFEEFKQLKTEQSASGSGLGLALCRNLIKLMNGTITVESIKGKGSTFRVSLPVTER